jgi:hypothetical protein
MGVKRAQGQAVIDVQMRWASVAWRAPAPLAQLLSITQSFFM